MNSYRNPLATWLGGVPSTNEDTNRVDAAGIAHSMQWVSANDPSFVVLHTMVGHVDSATSRFHNPVAQVSATYGITLAGSAVQWLDEKDAPYAEGNWDYNLNSIAIEHEDNSANGQYVGGYTEAQYAKSAELVKDICTRYGIPINRTYIIKHKEVPGASTACPDDLDVDRIVAMANGTYRGTMGTGNVAEPIREIVPLHPVVSVVYDITNADGSGNDRSAVDYNSVIYVPNQVWAAPDNGRGQVVSWERAKFVVDSKDGKSKWLNKIVGTTWAAWDECLDDGGFDPTHFAPTPVVPPVVVTPPVVKPPVVEPPVATPPVKPVVRYTSWLDILIGFIKLLLGRK